VCLEEDHFTWKCQGSTRPLLFVRLFLSTYSK
jgi:hypothetical protein